MLRCKDVTELIGTGGLSAAPLRTRMGVRLHLAWCRHCRAYARSLRQLAELARRAARVEGDASATRAGCVLDAVRREAESLQRPPADGG